MCASPYYKEKAIGEWFTFVAMTAFWVTLVLLLMYLFHAIEKFHVIPWLMIEFGFCALWTFFYFTAALASAVEVIFFIEWGDFSFSIKLMFLGSPQLSISSCSFLWFCLYDSVWV